MASINTSSVREELDRLKSEFKRVSSEHRISDEIAHADEQHVNAAGTDMRDLPGKIDHQKQQEFQQALVSN